MLVTMRAGCADLATLGRVGRQGDAAQGTLISKGETPQERVGGAEKGATTSQRDGVSFLNAVNAVDGG